MSFDYDESYDMSYDREDYDELPEPDYDYDQDEYNGEADEDFEPDYEERDDCDFQDPGGESALRRATRSNPRNLPCPDCGAPNRLTPKDRDLGYCCDSCARRNEGFGD